MPPFMSTAPRPWSSLPLISGVKASLAQPSPGGTTSRWPAKAKWGAPAPRVANKFSTGPSGASPKVKRWTVKPIPASASSSTSNTWPVAGVTLAQAMRRAARSTGSIVGFMAIA